jgi:hypothetical protein
MAGLTNAERVRYLRAMYQYMLANGVTEAKVADLGAHDQEMTEAETARYREAIERFKHAHGIAKPDMDDAIRWLMLRGDLVLSPEEERTYHGRRMLKALRPLLQGDGITRSHIADALRSLGAESTD